MYHIQKYWNDIDMVDRSWLRCGLFSVRLATISAAHQVPPHIAQNLHLPIYHDIAIVEVIKLILVIARLIKLYLSKSSLSWCEMLKHLQYIVNINQIISLEGWILTCQAGVASLTSHHSEDWMMVQLMMQYRNRYVHGDRSRKTVHLLEEHKMF